MVFLYDICGPLEVAMSNMCILGGSYITLSVVEIES